MRIYPIETGNFKLDGGAMFGVVPKSIWNKTNPADQNNQIELAARSLLIEVNKKLILIDCGLGNKQDESFFKHYSLFGNHSIEKSLAKYGFVKDDITDVFFTHFHFDHIGGATTWNENKTEIIPTFKNANYWTNKEHLNSVLNPNSREKASFLKENIEPLVKHNKLNFIPIPKDDYLFDSILGFDILFVDGHSQKQMIPILKLDDKTIVFCADLIPTTGHIPIAYITSYDVEPLKSLQEKEKFLNIACQNNYILFFQHDFKHIFATLQQTEKGIRIKETFNDIFL